jgi:Rhomboid-like protein
MRRQDLKRIFRSYAVAWVYLIGFVITEAVCSALSPHRLHAFTVWASTSVHNLQHDPVGSLVVSAFVSQGYWLAWPFLIALAIFGTNKVLGNWRTALVCGAGHVIGTLVSEGIVGYRVSHGSLPAADRYLIDVGPSYVVVTAIAVALLYGSWLARCAAALDLVLLVTVGNIFGGLSKLAVSAVGHTTAIAVGVILGSLLVWQLRRRPATSSSMADVDTGTG